LNILKLAQERVGAFVPGRIRAAGTLTLLCTLIKLRDAMLAEGVIHADETPVQMLTPGAKKPHRIYV
jgi:hypothetical protein